MTVAKNPAAVCGIDFNDFCLMRQREFRAWPEISGDGLQMPETEAPSRFERGKPRVLRNGRGRD
jgi:hypothetical protein